MQDVRVFLDKAKNGVVVISLGTNVKWKSLGIDKIKSVLLALSKLKQRVLWKLDIEVPFEIPDNVMVVKWILQNEVLCTFLDSIKNFNTDSNYCFNHQCFKNISQ